MSIVDVANAMAHQEDNLWNPSTMSWSAFNPNSLAQKNNNPGNLRFMGQSGATQGQGGFAKFDNVQAGFDALQRQINLDAGRGLSLDQFINKFAPPSENKTSTYLENVQTWLGISDSSTKLADVLTGQGAATDETPTLADVFGDSWGGEEGGLSTPVAIGLALVGGVVLWKIFA